MIEAPVRFQAPVLLESPGIIQDAEFTLFLAQLQSVDLAAPQVDGQPSISIHLNQPLEITPAPRVNPDILLARFTQRYKSAEVAKELIAANPDHPEATRQTGFLARLSETTRTAVENIDYQRQAARFNFPPESRPCDFCETSPARVEQNEADWNDHQLEFLLDFRQSHAIATQSFIVSGLTRDWRVATINGECDDSDSPPVKHSVSPA